MWNAKYYKISGWEKIGSSYWIKGALSEERMNLNECALCISWFCGETATCTRSTATAVIVVAGCGFVCSMVQKSNNNTALFQYYVRKSTPKTVCFILLLFFSSVFSALLYKLLIEPLWKEITPVHRCVFFNNAKMFALYWTNTRTRKSPHSWKSSALYQPRFGSFYY